MNIDPFFPGTPAIVQNTPQSFLIMIDLRFGNSTCASIVSQMPCWI